MYDGKPDLILLGALVIAVIAIIKLYTVLGRETPGDDGRRAERKAAERSAGGAFDPKVVTMKKRDAAPVADAQGDVAVADAEQRIRSFAAGDQAVIQGLLDIYRYDPAFDPNAFIKGGRQAYEMIVTAFAEGNRKMLKDLLAREVYDEFAAEMAARDKRGEIIDQSFVGIGKADIIEAETRNGTANITVRFVSQLISATRDKSGAVTSGDPQKIKEVTDVWTFSRDVATQRARQNLNWRLIATQES